MKPTKTLTVVSNMLLVLSATTLGSTNMITSAFAISDLRTAIETNLPMISPIDIQPDRGSSWTIPGRSGAAVTNLVLDADTHTKEKTATLIGKLVTTNGDGVARTKINIIDHSASSRSSSHGSAFDGKIIASVVTDSEGFYEATWIPHEPREYTIFAQFDGNQNYLSSKSNRITVNAE